MGVNIQVLTSAKLKENIKGARRSGQRLCPQGMEPCMLWAIDDTGPKYRETEAHVIIKKDEIKIAISIDSEFNFLMLNRPDYEYVAIFVSGRGAPFYMRFYPIYVSNDGIVTEFLCKIPEYSGNDIRRYKHEYHI